MVPGELFFQDKVKGIENEWQRLKVPGKFHFSKNS
jgi:hypothetical protein